jgi:hypothetical protein
MQQVLQGCKAPNAVVLPVTATANKGMAPADHVVLLAVLFVADARQWLSCVAVSAASPHGSLCQLC